MIAYFLGMFVCGFLVGYAIASIVASCKIGEMTEWCKKCFTCSQKNN